MRIGRLQDSTLITRRLAPVRHIVCASAQYVQSHIEFHHEAHEGHKEKQFKIPSCASWLKIESAKSIYLTIIRLQGIIDHRCIIYANAYDPNYWHFITHAAKQSLDLALQLTFIVYEAIQRGTLAPILPDVDFPWRLTHKLSTRPRGIYPAGLGYLWTISRFGELLLSVNPNLFGNLSTKQKSAIQFLLNQDALTPLIYCWIKKNCYSCHQKNT